VTLFYTEIALLSRVGGNTGRSLRQEFPLTAARGYGILTLCEHARQSAPVRISFFVSVSFAPLRIAKGECFLPPLLRRLAQQKANVTC
jgi:hypothetical protein